MNDTFASDIGSGVAIGVMLSFVIACLVCVCVALYYGGYKNGQVDYARGKIVYTMQTNDKGELVWTKR